MKEVEGILSKLDRDPKYIAKISNVEITKLASAGIEAAKLEKSVGKVVKRIKGHLLRYAQYKKVSVIETSKGIVEINTRVTNSISPSKLLNFLIKKDKKSLFYSLVKTKLTEVKRYFIAEQLTEITDTEEEEYGTLTFKSGKR